MKNNEWILKFKDTTYFDTRDITLKNSELKYVDTELRYELCDDGNSLALFRIYDLNDDFGSCIQFDIDELPKLIKELEAAYKRYKDFKENKN